jgi:hypothetical protein
MILRESEILMLGDALVVGIHVEVALVGGAAGGSPGIILRNSGSSRLAIHASLPV